MSITRKILLNILLLQVLIFIYIGSHNSTKNNSTKKASVLTLTSTIPQKKLPLSSQYTIWNEEEQVKVALQKVQALSTTPKVFLPPVIISQKLVCTKAISQKTVSQKTVSKKVIHKKTVAKISKRDKVAKYAKAKLGHKYVWGATGPQNFDCSGFTKEVFQETTGIKIPRVSRDQAKVGEYIKYKDLKEGDMVFFDTHKHYLGKVNHVGIYLKDGKFIHASSAKKRVIITSFKKKPFYKKRFLWGRRVIKTPS